MMMKKLTPEKIQEVTNFLSKCGLERRMTAGEVATAVRKLQATYTPAEFAEIKQKVLFNLNCMKIDSEFFHAKHFQGEDFKAYVVLAHEFITQHPEYEFNETYTRTRRRSPIIHPVKKRTTEEV